MLKCAREVHRYKTSVKINPSALTLTVDFDKRKSRRCLQTKTQAAIGHHFSEIGGESK